MLSGIFFYLYAQQKLESKITAWQKVVDIFDVNQTEN